ncbi:hypothetical protein J3459_013663 [Metarhizium acridum]|nr:hypothetical protein J3459_013663 [Metarhizium acridum]
MGPPLVRTLQLVAVPGARVSTAESTRASVTCASGLPLTLVITSPRAPFKTLFTLNEILDRAWNPCQYTESPMATSQAPTETLVSPKSSRLHQRLLVLRTSHIARAAEPTKGQAWAFPEEEIQRVGPPAHYDDSRRSSITESIASSQFTTESRLPPGQRRLEDGADYARMSTASNEFPPVHHHTMQHKQLSDLQAEEGSGPPGSQPYSRTPELRVSHKLAERKRRTEMKELFDQLRDLMPQERGSKASKWEILTKAIAEHQRQADAIRLLQYHCNNATSENEMLRRELQAMRMETAQLRGEIGSSGNPPQQAPPPPPLTGLTAAAASLVRQRHLRQYQ